MVWVTRRNLFLKSLILVAMSAVAVFALSEAPPAGLTGGVSGSLGERTCIECHSSFELNAGREKGGGFDILDVPEQYVPGQTYTITVQLSHPGQSRWGFELATRFVTDGSQAGTIIQTDMDNTQILPGVDLKYIAHTGIGTYAGVADGPVYWQFDWTAPDSGTVAFVAVGNAADNDGSAEGDYIYTTEQITTEGPIY